MEFLIITQCSQLFLDAAVFFFLYYLCLIIFNNQALTEFETYYLLYPVSCMDKSTDYWRFRLDKKRCALKFHWNYKSLSLAACQCFEIEYDIFDFNVLIVVQRRYLLNIAVIGFNYLNFSDNILNGSPVLLKTMNKQKNVSYTPLVRRPACRLSLLTLLSKRNEMSAIPPTTAATIK